jgi:hypothetical protein
MPEASDVGRGINSTETGRNPAVSSRGEVIGRRIAPRQARADTVPERHRLQRGADGGDVAVPAALADQAPAMLERAMDAAQRGIEIGNPVEYGVCEHGIELALERQLLRVELSRVDPRARAAATKSGAGSAPTTVAPRLQRSSASARRRRSRHRGCAHPDAAPAGRGRLPEIRDEARVGRVVRRVPSLRHSPLSSWRRVARAGQEFEEGVEAAVERAPQLRDRAVDGVQRQPGLFAAGELEPGVAGLSGALRHQPDPVNERVASHGFNILDGQAHGS